ncbi:MAG: sigma-70 family RNA polymerase sigma factor [Chitinispirillales bacterium]|jgi:RNA polymerase sigma-70 factor (ECF subfamily)|nr:sigma-70 family RNA polymerase sigma factor [Chitinispirillales bacterium]
MSANKDNRLVDAEELFKKYWTMVLRRCQEILGDTDGAVDVAQEVFVIVLDRQDRLYADYPVSLLWRIATNNCLKVLRSRASRSNMLDRESLLEQIVYSGDIEAEVANRSVLRKLFNRHPESSRTIAVLHLVDGMTLKETALTMNMSVSGVRKRLRALRKTLREMEGG